MYSIDAADGLSIDLRTATSSDHSSARNPLGAIVVCDDGRAYRYLKSNQATAVGQIVTPLLGIDDADVDSAATTSESTLTATGDFTANEFDDMASFVTINANDGLWQTRRILSNSANVLYLDAVWGVALTTSSDYVVWSGYEVELCDAAAERVAGVALSALTAGNYGWFQVGGIGYVRFVGSTDPSAVHEGLVSSATEGVAKGLTAGGTTADEADKSFGSAMLVHAAADAAGQLLPVYLSKIIGYS
jgi:hypothetical protein